MNITKLMEYQFNNKYFNRMDVFVRYMYIEDYYGKKYDIDIKKLYEKMQKCRMTRDGFNKIKGFKQFDKLIEDFSKNRYNNNYPIKINHNNQLDDGSHRLACSLFFNIKEIPCIEADNRDIVSYDINWFKNNNFSKKEIELIIKTKDRILKKLNLYFIITLWGAVKPYFKNITNELNQRYHVMEYNDYSFNTFNRYNKFIKSIYSCDDISMEKVKTKINYLKNYEYTVRIIKIDIGNPFFRTKQISGKPLSTIGEQIKKYYRNKYKIKLDKYFYDIIIHTGDNYEHTLYINNVLIKMKQTEYLDKLNKELKKYNIKTNDYCIVGSFAIKNLLGNNYNDIDILVNPKVRNKITKNNKAFKLSNDIEIVGTNWGKSLYMRDKELITEYSHNINGYNIINKNIQLKKMKKSKRPKDIIRIYNYLYGVI
jgi:hypothetical protein